MYSELYQYFVQHKKLNLPGIGNFILERKPSEADFVNKCIHPSSFMVSLQQAVEKPSAKFFAWIASVFSISDREAIIRFNDFVFELKKEIARGNRIDWKGMGVLSKGLGENVRFVAHPVESIEKTVPAEKIIREKAEHAVLVGEKERTSVEMTEYFSQQGIKKNYWWALPLTIGLLTFMFTAWYFSKHGVSGSSLSNTQKLVPSTAQETYREIK